MGRGVSLTYLEKQQILNKEIKSPVKKGTARNWDAHLINAAVALDYGHLATLRGDKRRQAEQLAAQMRSDAPSDDEEEDDESISEEEDDDEDVVVEDDDTQDDNIATATTKPSISILNVGSIIALWLIVTTSFCLHHLQTSTSSTSPLTLSILFFNNLNIFIAICEICLGLNISYIQGHYTQLREQYPEGYEWSACMAYLTMPLTLRDVFAAKTWSMMWSTYALYDPSYQNHESFGFFIDFGNGLSTIPPSILMNVAIIWPEKVSPLWVGCICLAMYWQVMYGAIVYVFTFMFNRRYEGKQLLEVSLFVGFSNSLWIIFPPLGIFACVSMLRDGSLAVFQ